MAHEERPLTYDPHSDSVIQGEELLSSSYGNREIRGWHGYRRGRLTDFLYQVRLLFNPSFGELSRIAKRMPVRRVHVAGVDVPARRDDLAAVVRTLRDTRHAVTVSLAPLGDRGKFENINVALRDIDMREIDWLIVADDDIALPPQFLDRFLCACEAASLRIAQPAHRFHSHTTWQITQRRWNALVHTTHFVECGPITAFHRDVFSHVLPFPETRWAWGIDIIWGEIARREGFNVGVVDATPVAHLRPVAASYDATAAIEEGQRLLKQFNVRRSNREVLKTTDVFTELDYSRVDDVAFRRQRQRAKSDVLMTPLEGSVRDRS